MVSLEREESVDHRRRTTNHRYFLIYNSLLRPQRPKAPRAHEESAAPRESGLLGELKLQTSGYARCASSSSTTHSGDTARFSRGALIKIRGMLAIIRGRNDAPSDSCKTKDSQTTLYSPCSATEQLVVDACDMAKRCLRTKANFPMVLRLMRLVSTLVVRFHLRLGVKAGELVCMLIRMLPQPLESAAASSTTRLLRMPSSGGGSRNGRKG